MITTSKAPATTTLPYEHVTMTRVFPTHLQTFMEAVRRALVERAAFTSTPCARIAP